MRVRDSTIRFEASQRAFFCLNLGAAFALTFLFYWLGAHGGYPHGRLRAPSSVGESLFNAIFLNRLPWDPIGSTVALLSLTLVVAALLWVLLHLIRSRHAIHLVLTFGGGAAALGAVPLCWVNSSPGLPQGLTFNPAAWYLALLEFSIVCGALYLLRGAHFAIWLIVVLVHYGVWGWFLLELADFHGSVTLGWPPIYLSLVAPCAGLAWVLYVRLGNTERG